MDPTLVPGSPTPIVECRSPVRSVDDALLLIASCSEQGTDLLLLPAAVLPEAFFDLQTRFAGEFLQKLLNYRLRIALVVPADQAHSARFHEFLLEAGRGMQFRAFSSRDDAIHWLGEG